MTEFIFLCQDHGITIQTDSYCHFFDNAKNASEAAFELMQGGNTTDWDNNEPHNRIVIHTGNQDDLLEIVNNYTHMQELESIDGNLEAKFYENVHWAFYIRGLSKAREYNFSEPRSND
tara:strand:- start:46 stop:399 length:354 start_codon:yes stop_codon:yes gene_type:complete